MLKFRCFQSNALFGLASEFDGCRVFSSQNVGKIFVKLGGVSGAKHALWIPGTVLELSDSRRVDAIADEIHFDAILIDCGSTEPGVNQLGERVSTVISVGKKH